MNNIISIIEEQDHILEEVNKYILLKEHSYKKINNGKELYNEINKNTKRIRASFLKINKLQKKIDDITGENSTLYEHNKIIALFNSPFISKLKRIDIKSYRKLNNDLEEN